MNERREFQVSQETRSADARKAADARDIARKSAPAQVLDPSVLSEAELELMSSEGFDGPARIWLNGELMKVGRKWMPGAKAKWLAGGNLDDEDEEEDDAVKAAEGSNCKGASSGHPGQSAREHSPAPDRKPPPREVREQ